MAQISIADASPREQYTVNATPQTGPWTVSHPFFDLDDYLIYKDATLMTRGVDYTLTGTAVDDGYSGGTVNWLSSIASVTLTFVRDIPISRTTDFPTSGYFNVASLNTALDKLFAIQQEVETKLLRSVQLSITDTSSTPGTLPVAVDGSGLYWNGTVLDNTSFNMVDLSATLPDAVAQVALATTARIAAEAAKAGADADLVLTNADVVLTNADVVLTNADVVLTNADVTATAANAVLSAADLVQTDLDVTATAASASAAATSASGAATSASAAATSASAAATSATNAGTSETNAGTSATAAAASATAAAADLVLTDLDTVATAADAVSTAADLVQTDLDVTATAASASAASTSASGAATSATNAGTSETNASGSASAAATSATNAATSATNAGTSATSAAASAVLTAADLAEFQGIYYGSLASAPTVSVASGDIYFDTGSSQLLVYNGSTWQAGVTSTSGLQPIDAALTSLSNLTTAADKMVYTTASDTYAVTSLSAAGRAILDDANAAAQLVTLGAAPLASPAFTGTATFNDLTVNGTTTTVNSTVTVIQDPIITIGGAADGAAPGSDDGKDRGMVLQYHNGSAAKLAFMGFDDTDSKFMFVPDATVSAEVVSGAVGSIKAAAIDFSDGSSQSSAGASTGKAIAMAMVFG
jgi:hypothetical protein